MNARTAPSLPMEFAARYFGAAPVTDALAGQSYFTILARRVGEVRLWTVEGPLPQSMAEVLEEVQQNERAVHVFRCDPDLPSRDVSVDVARMWLKELWSQGFDPTEERIPAFIGEHLTNDEIERAE